MVTYATRADLHRYGLPRGLLANPGRLVAAVYAATDTLELDGHGVETDLPIVFRAESGGSLPAPLAAGTTYYGIRLTDSTFQVAATAGGAAIGLTSAGSRVVMSTSLPVDEVLERYSRFVDDHLPAHVVPLTVPYPVRVVAVVAELASQRLLWIAGQKSIAMDAIEAGAHKEIDRWAKGLPLRDATATAASNLAVSASASSGWGLPGVLP